MAKHYRRLTSCLIASVVPSILACGAETQPSDVGTSAQELCTGGRLTASDADYVAEAGPLVTWTATASCQFVNPQFRFWRRAPGQSYVVVRDWSTASTYDWSTAGAAEGTYNWQVWAREGGSTAAYETYSSRTFTITSVPACSSATATTTPAMAGIGSAVAITASADCGGLPAEYAFYRRAPGATSWTLVQPYSSSATFNWDTVGATAGVYNYQVWVRGQGRPGAYDTYTALTYNLQTDSPCTGASLSFTPPSPGTQGDLVTIQGSSASCATPTYAFWMYNGSAWTVVQNWSTSATTIWDTGSVATGTYQFQVWVRQQGSSADYETYRALDYVVASGTPGSLATSMTGGTNFTCQLLASGQVGCWGYNTDGQLGNGSNATSRVPVAVSGLTTGIRLSTGYYHSCAVLSTGGVRCWGDNLRGQLGDGTTADANSPVAVSTLSTAVNVTAGAAHSCAVLSNGSVRCWGYNSQGQVGVAPSALQTTPVAVPGLTGVTQVAAGYYHTCALMSDQTVRCWGGGDFGQLGNGNTIDSVTPVVVTGLTGVTAIAAASSHTCALLTDGTVRCWGQNLNGVLGNGSTNSSSLPVAAAGVSGVTSLGIGPYHVCVSTSAGGAYCWGLNFYGELGDGTTTDSLTPVPVTGLTTASSIGVGHHHSCATLSNGSAVCWGYNALGQLGNNSAASSLTPTPVAPFP